jgi:hypothetical protein
VRCPVPPWSDGHQDSLSPTIDDHQGVPVPTAKHPRYTVPREIGIRQLRLLAHCFDKDITLLCIGPDCEFWRHEIECGGESR